MVFSSKFKAVEIMARIHWKGNRDKYQYSLRSAPWWALEHLIIDQMKESGLKDIPEVLHHELILFIQNGLHIRFKGGDTALTAIKFNGML